MARTIKNVSKKLAKGYVDKKGDAMSTNAGCWIYLIVIFLILAFNFFIGGLLVQYSVEYWVERIKDAPVDANYWICCLVGIPTAQLALPIAAVTWIIKTVS